jgi:hypothetical protein
MIEQTQTIYIAGLSRAQAKRIESNGFAVDYSHGYPMVVLTVTRRIAEHLQEIGTLMAPEPVDIRA